MHFFFFFFFFNNFICTMGERGYGPKFICLETPRVVRYQLWNKFFQGFCFSLGVKMRFGCFEWHVRRMATMYCFFFFLNDQKESITFRIWLLLESKIYNMLSSSSQVCKRKQQRVKEAMAWTSVGCWQGPSDAFANIWEIEKESKVYCD